MTLASGAHVKIGSYEFMLDETIDAGTATGNLYRPHYKHTYESLFPNDRNLVGMATANDVQPNRLVWSFDDWSGGENNRIYYPDDPTVYDYAHGTNPRIRGNITGRPTRTYLGSTLTAGDTSKRPILALSQSALWYAGSYRIGYSNDNGATWQVVDSTSVAGTDLTNLQNLTTTHIYDYAITAATGNSEYFFYAAYNNTTGKHIINAKKKDNTNKAGPLKAEGSGNPWAGLCIMNGRLYSWTGAKLEEWDIFNLSGNTPSVLASDQYRVVGNTGIDPSTNNVFGSSWWANCVATENEVFMFYSTDGQSQVYSFSNAGGFGPVWNPPFGLTIKSMKYMNGILFMAGHWGGDSNATGHGVLYAMPLDTLKPVFVSFFRKQNGDNLQMQEMATSYGAQLLLAAAVTGRIFVYDAELDAVSMLDSIATAGMTVEVPATDALSFTSNSDRIGDLITFGTKRHAITFTPSASTGTTGNYNLLSYADDEPGNRQAGTATNSAVTVLYTGEWDFNLPFEQKALMGFDVSFRPLTTGQSIQIEYSMDRASFVSAGTLTSASADAAKGRSFIQVSDGTTTSKFTQLRVRVTLTGTSGNLPPIVRNVSTEARLISYDQTWELIVRLKDDQTRQQSGKRQQKGATARDWLLSVVDNKAVVTFLDGYRYELPGHYTTHTVVIEDPEDIIIRKGEGSMRLKLRSIPV